MASNNRERLEELKREEQRILFEQLHCRHHFGEPKYDPEIVKEPYGFHTVGRGSDVWSEPTGYHDVTKDRWSRECTKCGKVEYTHRQEPVIKEYKPKF